MITPSFNLTATERVLPKLALDFTTGTFDPRVTFTRSGNTATVTNSTGVIAAVNADIPRFDYDPITLACKGLLIEESRANLFLYSEQFQQADWVKSSVTVDDDAIASPDGTTNADKVILDSGVASASGVIRQQITKAASAITYTCSFYAKAGEFNSVRVIFRDTASSANFVQAYFNLNLGTVSTAANAGGTYTNPSASIAAAGNGWYRCVLTGTTGTNTTTDMRVLQYNNGNGSVTGDGTSGLYIWGAQLEAGAFATSYIPTTTTALTRNADVATMTGTNFSDWFNASEGTFYALWAEGGDSSLYGVLSADDGTTDNYVDIRRQSSTSVRSLVRSGASAIATLALTNNYAANQQLAFVSAYKVDSYAGSVNQSAVNTDSAGAVPVSQNQLQLGTLAGATPYQLNGWLQQLKYWPQRLTNAEVQAFAK